MKRNIISKGQQTINVSYLYLYELIKCSFRIDNILSIVTWKNIYIIKVYINLKFKHWILKNIKVKKNHIWWMIPYRLLRKDSHLGCNSILRRKRKTVCLIPTFYFFFSLVCHRRGYKSHVRLMCSISQRNQLHWH